jgi:hypothetical protein
VQNIASLTACSSFDHADSSLLPYVQVRPRLYNLRQSFITWGQEDCKQHMQWSTVNIDIQVVLGVVSFPPTMELPSDLNASNCPLKHFDGGPTLVFEASSLLGVFGVTAGAFLSLSDVLRGGTSGKS